MARDTGLLFQSLLDSAEVRKVDFKQSQYRLENEGLKSHFVKDVLCMANAPGGEGYIVLGVSVQGNKRTVVGISGDHDSSALEELVASVIEEPIQFDYEPVVHQGKSCALICIPSSNARPHWPKKDFGILKNHVFYTRRASGNREASHSEIREMFLSTIRVSDVARRTGRASYISDELARFEIGERTDAMYNMLKGVAPKLPWGDYRMVPKFTETRGLPTRSFALVGNAGTGGREYAVFMHPIRATRDDVGWARYSLRQVREAYSDYVANKGKRNKGSMGLEAATYKMGKKLAILGGHLEQCNVVHISYQGIYTGFGYGRQWAPFGRLRNTWAEPWGKVFKWQSFGATLFYEFFLRDVTSQAYLSQCLSNVQSWFDTHPL